jgi:serine protease Do
MSGSSTCFRAILVSSVALACFGRLMGAQERDDGLPSSAAAKAAQSIVAIARVRLDESAPGFIERERFPPEDYWMGPGPADPGFFPHEFGVGVVIDRGGLILTSLHVLGEISRSRYFVWAQRRAFPARVKAADPWLDVAVLEIAADDLSPVEFGNARQVKPGDNVYALGAPLDIARDGEPTIVAGRITQLACEAPAQFLPVMRNGLEQIAPRRETLHHYGTLLQFDAEREMSCSGGALLDERGQLVGLTTTYTRASEQPAHGELAIPIDDDFSKALETLKRGALPEYGLLGLAPRDARNARGQSRSATQRRCYARRRPAREGRSAPDSSDQCIARGIAGHAQGAARQKGADACGNAVQEISGIGS